MNALAAIATLGALHAVAYACRRANRETGTDLEEAPEPYTPPRHLHPWSDDETRDIWNNRCEEWKYKASHTDPFTTNMMAAIEEDRPSH